MTPSHPDATHDAGAVEHEAAPKYYQVKKGDTLYGIALAVGRDYRDIAAWNGLTNADMLVAGQTLRLTPPEQKSDKPAAVAAEPAPKKARPPYQDANDPFANLARLGTAPAAQPSARPNETDAGTPAVSLSWVRPSRNRLLSPYLEGINRGVDFDGAIGDPIVAATAGKVTLVTNALRGYGNLVVIKHDADYISVYKHASKILVREGQVVAAGQKIAEIGSSDSDRPKLHFEIRKSGRPVDPAKLLPPT